MKMASYKSFSSPTCVLEEPKAQAFAEEHKPSGAYGQGDDLQLQQHESHVGFAECASLLRCCGNSKDLAEGKKLHAQIASRGFATSILVRNLIVEMYGKCGSLDEACSVFEEMPYRNVFSWTIMIAAYAQNGHHRRGLLLFWRMNLEGVKPDKVGFVTLLDAVSTVVSYSEARLIQACIVETGFGSDIVLGNALLNAYSKCGSLENARDFFDQMHQRDVITWTCMIAAYAQSGHLDKSFQLLRRMDLEGVRPNAVTFTNLLTAFSQLADDSRLVNCVHARIVDCGFVPVVGCSLIDVHGKLGRVGDARAIFENMQLKNVVSWTAVITAYAQNGDCKEAIQLFRRMDLEGVKADAITFLSILDACARSEALEEGMLIHVRIAESGLDSCTTVGNSLVSMYGKCGRVEDAKTTFEKIRVKNIVTWTALIAAYAQNGHPEDAFGLFCRMDLDGMQPNLITLVTMLDACSSLADLTRGKLIHECIDLCGYQPDMILGNALVNMYGKCGSTEKAKVVFDSMRQRDLCAWNAVVAAYTQTGHIKEALQLMQEMNLQGVSSTAITFLHILSAFSHAGLLDSCRLYLMSMSRDYGITPAADHYRCMIDLLARLGRLNLAEELMSSMPFEPNEFAWMSILAACKVHGDSNTGTSAAERVFELEPENASPYLVLANIYTSEQERT